MVTNNARKFFGKRMQKVKISCEGARGAEERSNRSIKRRAGGWDEERGRRRGGMGDEGAAAAAMTPTNRTVLVGNRGLLHQGEGPINRTKADRKVRPPILHFPRERTFYRTQMMDNGSSITFFSPRTEIENNAHWTVFGEPCGEPLVAVDPRNLRDSITQLVINEAEERKSVSH